MSSPYTVLLCTSDEDARALPSYLTSVRPFTFLRMDAEDCADARRFFGFDARVSVDLYMSEPGQEGAMMRGLVAWASATEGAELLVLLDYEPIMMWQARQLHLPETERAFFTREVPVDVLKSALWTLEP